MVSATSAAPRPLYQAPYGQSTQPSFGHVQHNGQAQHYQPGPRDKQHYHWLPGSAPVSGCPVVPPAQDDMMPALLVSDKRLDWSVLPVLNVEKFARMLNEYDIMKTEYLVQGLKNGFSTGYNGSYENVYVKNLTSAINRPHVMREILNKEIN